MALNLRELAESALSFTLEGRYSLPIELIGPDGTEYTGINGQVMMDRTKIDMETGADMWISKPVAVLRKSSLTRIPLDSDSQWFCRIPLTPSTTADLVTHRVERVAEGGDSIGFIRLYLALAEQS